MDVLDIACGTGVLFPDYLKRGEESLTAFGLSPEMTKFDRQFDAVLKELTAENI